jgi:diguanylate cyclase (GGDEF)-like protein
MLRDLKKLASTDNLTGIYNRHYFETILIRELDRSNRYGVSLSLIMFDVDHFKSINDTYGHDVGDSVLRKLTSVVKHAIRESDYFVRWGGEEFIILCPEITHEQGRVVAEKVRHVISETTFDTVGKITASFGATSYKKSERSESFLKRADELLYRAKDSGRNQVVIDSEE